MTVSAPPRPPSQAPRLRQQASRTRGDRSPRRGADRGGAAESSVVAIAGTGRSQRSRRSSAWLSSSFLDGGAASQTASSGALRAVEPFRRSGNSEDRLHQRTPGVGSASRRRALRRERRRQRASGSCTSARAQLLPGRPTGGRSPSEPASDRRLRHERRRQRAAEPDARPGATAILSGRPTGGRSPSSRSGTEIYVMNADGSGQRRLTRNAATGSLLPGRPTGGRSPSSAPATATARRSTS